MVVEYEESKNVILATLSSWALRKQLQDRAYGVGSSAQGLGAGVLPWKGRGGGLEEERKRLGVRTSSGCALADKPWMLYIILPQPISIIDCDNMYTLVFLPGLHIQKSWAAFSLSNRFVNRLWGTFSLVATLAVNTAPYRRELHSPSVHQTTRPTGYYLFWSTASTGRGP